MSMECKLCEIVSAKLRLVGFFLVHLLGLFTTLFFPFYLNPIFLSVNVVKEKVSGLLNSSFSSFQKKSLALLRFVFLGDDPIPIRIIQFFHSLSVLTKIRSFCFDYF